jgi:multiple sugar transport system permease protein
MTTLPGPMAAPSRRVRRVPQELIGLAWVSPWLVGFAAFTVLPLAMALYYSLCDYNVLEPAIFIGGENYRRMMGDDLFWTALRNTVVFAVFSIPLGTALSLVIASLLNQRVRMLGGFRAAIFVPALVPIVAQAMIWLWLFNGEMGLVNQALRLVGLEGPNWLRDASWAMPSLIIISLWTVGQAVVVYLAALQGVPDHLYEAAHLDGFGPVRTFWHVTLPMISPAILFNTVIAIINAWQVFAVPYIMTEGGPGRATYFSTMYLYDNAFQYLDMGYASALAWVQFVIILALTGLTFLFSKRFVHHGGS